MIEILAQISAPHFCAGIVLHDSKVIKAAPIVRKMIGWSRKDVRTFCQFRGWKISVVERKARAD